MSRHRPAPAAAIRRLKVHPLRAEREAVTVDAAPLPPAFPSPLVKERTPPRLRAAPILYQPPAQKSSLFFISFHIQRPGRDFGRFPPRGRGTGQASLPRTPAPSPTSGVAHAIAPPSSPGRPTRIDRLPADQPRLPHRGLTGLHFVSRPTPAPPTARRPPRRPVAGALYSAPGNDVGPKPAPRCSMITINHRIPKGSRPPSAFR